MAVERLARWCRAGGVTPARLGRAFALPASKHRVLLLALELQNQKPASGFRRGAVLPDEDGLVPRQRDDVLRIRETANRSRIAFWYTVDDGFRSGHLGTEQQNRERGKGEKERALHDGPS